MDRPVPPRAGRLAKKPALPQSCPELRRFALKRAGVLREKEAGPAGLDFPLAVPILLRVGPPRLRHSRDTSWSGLDARSSSNRSTLVLSAEPKMLYESALPPFTGSVP